MVFKHDTGSYNVEASLVAWLRGELDANQPPAISAVRLNLNAPETPIEPPEWSVHFTGTSSAETPLQGKNPGGWRFGVMEVNCWASRSDANWRAQINQMSDAVTVAVQGTSHVIIKDFYTSADTPANTGNRVTVLRVEQRQPPTDPNPDIERRRLLIYYQWVERGA